MYGKSIEQKVSESVPAIKAGIPRPLEALVSLIGLILVTPLIAVAGLAIALTSRGPIIFRQERMGLRGKRFVLYKLRTMKMSQRGAQVTAKNDSRVTWVGKILRKTKIDELPELWNVFRGDMSLVGPRPEVTRYVDLNNPMWQTVLMARPGITDPMTLLLRNEEELLASVAGDRESFYLNTLQPYKLNGYVEYLSQRNWYSDIKILWKTGLAVIIPSNAPPPTIEDISTY